MAVVQFENRTETGRTRRVEQWTTASSLGFSLSVHGRLEPLSEEWAAFETTAIATSFQYFGFVSAWMHHIGKPGGVKPVIVVGRDNLGAIAFILPFSVRKTGPFKVLEWLGAEHANYQAGLYSRSFLEQLNPVSFKILWREILAVLPAFDCMRLTNQPERLDGIENPFAVLGQSWCPDHYYVFQLESDFKTLYARKRSARTRRTHRKRDQKLEKMGAVEFVKEYDREIIAETLDALFMEKNQQLAKFGFREKFPEPVQDLCRDLITGADIPSPLFELFTLRLDGACIAASINTIFDKTFCGVVLFMARGPTDRFSPGDRLIRNLIEWSCEQGLETFDLSLGRAPYKQAWADEERRLFETTASNTLRGWLYVIAQNCLCTVKRQIKKSDRSIRVVHALLSVIRR